MTTPTQTKTGLVATIVTAIQSQSTALLDFAIGSILLAVTEAVADIALWLQGLVVYAVSLARAQTSAGADLDSWLAQFNYVRLGATAATATLTFGRFNATLATYIPVGATVQTTDGTQTFTVGTSVSNGAYSANAGGAGVQGYVLGAGTLSVSVPATAVTSGTSGNVLANMLTVITAPIVGVDYVTNASAATGGTNSQTDAQARAGFVAWLPTLFAGTVQAVTGAALGVQSGLFVTVLENVTAAGAAQLGALTVVVDDGTGSPPGSLLASVATAVGNVRPVGIGWGVVGPALVSATVVLNVRVASGYASATVQAAVQKAITGYINSIGFGGTVSFNRLAQIAFDASPGVVNISGITMNGGTADIVATGKQIIRAASVTIGTY
jgi:uncharacterized phage protein gp47/JayE